ncbi:MULTISPECIES: CotY/CotZ family spore coat protein [Bacillaceae]|uniref:CotY/CotZ family spore coat protein n=1 Tax=Bacillaceae TaxID=186817 RepID=UPI000C76F800|nr:MULTISPECIES: CotY/CotZ family spore coat protein [Bacillus]MCA1034327.1 spore coat protein CotZ [Bacillus infantis]MDW2877584.1 CotY/CotZ family spore coat protein [Bacillus infantis]PLR71678.1 spore coat protein CotZ [Bacillus sp. UMB0728]
MGCGKKDDVYSSKSCVCEVVRAIKDIQDNAEDVCECPTNCFLEPLGTLVSPSKRQNADTRVFVLKTADGSPFHAFFRGSDCSCVSIFFRVEDVFDNCCAVLRVLEPQKRTHDGYDTVDLTEDCCIDLKKVCQVDRFVKTNDCITVDLKCFCAVQCIADVNLDICD